MKFLLSMFALLLVSCGGDFSQRKAVADEPVEDGCVCNSCECYDDGTCICSDCECPGAACCEAGCDGDDCAMGACDCPDGCECPCGEAGDSDGTDGPDRGDGGDGGCDGGSCKPFTLWLDCRTIEYSQAPDGTLGDRLRCL